MTSEADSFFYAIWKTFNITLGSIPDKSALLFKIIIFSNYLCYSTFSNLENLPILIGKDLYFDIVVMYPLINRRYKKQ